MWGDSSLWYKIADSNGLSAGASLFAGESLTVPSGVTRLHNNASTSTPYDSTDAIGNISPTAPKPQKNKNKCGVFGQVLLAVVQIGVTIALSAIGVPPIVAQIGADIVKQGVGVATGIQSKFSFGEVATTALTAELEPPATGNVLTDAFQAAATNATVQGISVATGLQSKFDWAGVAAAGVSGGVGSALGNTTFMRDVGQKFGQAGQQFIGVGARAIVNAATRSLINGSDFGDNLLAGLPDVIGQTIGGIIADGVSGRTTRAPAAASSNGGAAATADTGAANQPVTGVEGGGQVGGQQTDEGDGQTIIVTGSRRSLFTYNPYVVPSSTIAARKQFIASLPVDQRVRLVADLRGSGQAARTRTGNGLIPGNNAFPDSQWGPDGLSMIGFFDSERYVTIETANAGDIAGYLNGMFDSLVANDPQWAALPPDQQLPSFGTAFAQGSEFQQAMAIPLLQMGAQYEAEHQFSGAATAALNGVLATGVSPDYVNWENLRLPDSFTISASTPNFGASSAIGYSSLAAGNIQGLLIAGLADNYGGVSLSGSLTIDRYGNLYGGFGPVGTVQQMSKAPNVSAYFSWADGYAKPSEQQLISSISGWSTSYSAGDVVLVGRSGNMTNVGLALTPQVSADRTYNWKLYNIYHH